MSGASDPMYERFRDIAGERLRAINAGVMKLEGGEGDATTVDAVMREIHTLKGESRMLGLGALNRLAHRTEDLLLHAKREDQLADAAWLGLVYAGLDLITEILGEALGLAATAEDPRAVAFSEKVVDLLGATDDSQPPTPPSAPPKPMPTPPAPPEPPVSDLPSQRVPRVLVDEITRTSGELGVLQAHMRQFAEEARNVLHRYREVRGAGLSPAVAEELATELDRVLRAMHDVGFDASLRHHRLQAAVERMRLAPVSRLFNRYPRMVRDLAKELGKEARLVIHGETVGADQQVLDLLPDPLVHLIRNAIDHGLEPPETREASGKPRSGTVQLIARQAGRFVELLVQDDGRGIDAGRIADAAVQKGLLSEADVEHMSERELLGQLFRPAFSTRTTVSDVSGRGVGLDVVKTTVDDLGGSIAIESRVGEGTTFLLRLPVSIALVDALVLDLGHALYAVPSAYVEQILELESSRLETTAGCEMVELDDGERAPAFDLIDLLQLPPAESPADELTRLVVIRESDRRIAVRVPGFVGELALVQDAMDPFLKGLRVVTGTAMLDGGRRVVLLNGVQLLDIARDARRAGRAPVAPRAAQASARTALVVEDSDLTRSMVVSALEGAGWRVFQAVNGRAGLQVFEQEAPDLVITDLEMPVLDGLGVIRGVRGGTTRPKVPIVVFSTRNDEASKRSAADVGADVYLVKSTFDATDALEVFERLLSRTDTGEDG